MAFKLFDLNMVEIPTRNVKTIEFVPQRASVDRETDRAGHGEIVLGRRRNPRIINAKVWLTSYTAGTFKDFMSELQEQWDPLGQYYAIDDDEPHKRWLVEFNSLETERINRNTAEINVEFYNAKGFAESLSTSLNPVTFAYNRMEFGKQVPIPTDVQDYIHTAQNFTVYNPSSFRIDPTDLHTRKIYIKPLGNGSNITLTNLTTNQVWKYTGTFNSGDNILLDGVKYTKNGLRIENSTNIFDFNAVITLAKGDNKFKISGGANFEVKFDFPFLYL